MFFCFVFFCVCVLPGVYGGRGAREEGMMRRGGVRQYHPTNLFQPSVILNSFYLELFSHPLIRYSLIRRRSSSEIEEKTGFNGDGFRLKGCFIASSFSSNRSLAQEDWQHFTTFSTILSTEQSLLSRVWGHDASLPDFYLKIEGIIHYFYKRKTVKGRIAQHLNFNWNIYHFVI